MRYSMKKCIICGKTFGFFDNKKYHSLFENIKPSDPIIYKKISEIYGENAKNHVICFNPPSNHGTGTDLYAIARLDTSYRNLGDLRRGKLHGKTHLLTIKQSFEVIEQIQEKTIREIFVEDTKELKCHIDSLYQKAFEEYDSLSCGFIDSVSTLIKNAEKNKPSIDFEQYTFASDEEYFYCFYLGQRFIKAVVESLNQTDIWQRLQLGMIIEDYTEQPDKFLLKIKKEDILFYQEKGSVQYSTEVYGGGGTNKDINIKGAVIGGLLFGEVGAIIGSRKDTGIKINEVKSKTIKHDSRNVILCYKDNQHNTINMEFPYKCYDIFTTLIAEKEYGCVQVERNTKNESRLPIEELKQLKELLDLGIISENDYDLKKKQLLGL